MESYVVQIGNVIDTSGVLTQIYPNWMTAGSSPSAGVLVRQPTDGVLYEMAIYPDDAQGGILEVYDIAGTLSGTNDTNTATSMTAAYLTAQLARTQPRAKLIWQQEFKADPGLTTKKFTQRTKLNFGLAVRWITAGVTAGTKTASLNITSEGLYRKVTVQG